MTIVANGGIRVPQWLVTAVIIAVALLSAGYAAGQKLTAKASQMETIELRLCRIERALQLEPWPGCPAVPVNRRAP